MKPKNNGNEPSLAEEHPKQDEVAQRAYELYQARGGKPGHDLQDWLEAEQEVNNRRQLIHVDG